MHDPIPEECPVDDVPEPVKVSEDIVDNTRTGLQESIDSRPELGYSAIFSIEACSGAVTFISVQVISNANPSVLTRVIATWIHNV